MNRVTVQNLVTAALVLAHEVETRRSCGGYSPAAHGLGFLVSAAMADSAVKGELLHQLAATWDHAVPGNRCPESVEMLVRDMLPDHWIDEIQTIVEQELAALAANT